MRSLLLTTSFYYEYKVFSAIHSGLNYDRITFT